MPVRGARDSEHLGRLWSGAAAHNDGYGAWSARVPAGRGDAERRLDPLALKAPTATVGPRGGGGGVGDGGGVAVPGDGVDVVLG